MQLHHNQKSIDKQNEIANAINDQSGFATAYIPRIHATPLPPLNL